MDPLPNLLRWTWKQLWNNAWINVLRKFSRSTSRCRLEFLKNLADKSVHWERSNEKSIYSRSSAHFVGSSAALEAKIDAMINKIDKVLLSNQMNQVYQVMCYKCNDPNHITDQCPYSLEQLNLFNRVRNDPFAPTYNPSWRNRPNFSWN